MLRGFPALRFFHAASGALRRGAARARATLPRASPLSRRMRCRNTLDCTATVRAAPRVAASGVMEPLAYVALGSRVMFLY